jgi:hypothetical protein
MKMFCCFSKAFRDETCFGGKFFVLCLLPLIFCLSACPTNAGSGTGKGADTNPKPQDQFIPQEGKPALEPEREVISERDVLGEYKGNISVLMDGKQYGPYVETVKIVKKTSGNISFVSQRTLYNGSMPVDIGYVFNTPVSSSDFNFMLTYAPDKKSVSFTGKKATMLYYTRNDTTSPPKEENSDTSIKGFIYKQKGTVYINFSVQYDTSATRRAFPTIPQGTHEAMSSTMQKGTKK